uniref:Ig-like domain-containing protein n=1 Tax=Podarcis muralis TaxID=64176 RepID=A0A670JUY3_PODMU
ESSPWPGPCFSLPFSITVQVRMQSPASQSVSLGETAKLPCSKSSGSWHSFYWYQQKPGQAPRFVFYGTSTRGEGIPDRFTASVSGNTGHLTISNTQAEDEAVYYCADWETADGSEERQRCQLSTSPWSVLKKPGTSK